MARLIISAALLLALSLISTSNPEPAHAKHLHGKVSQDALLERKGDGTLDGSTPSLTRTDLDKSRPASSKGDMPAQMDSKKLSPFIDAPQELFENLPTTPAENAAFSLSADKDGFAGQKLLGSPDAFPTVSPLGQSPLAPIDPAALELMPGRPGFNQPFDPDETRAMQLAWDAWHRRVAGDIYSRFASYVNTVFKGMPGLALRASYVVTRDGRIQNIRLVQRSANPMFNAMVVNVIKSINGDINLLRFPEGSRRVAVEKFGTFTTSTSQMGFRYTTGDRETIRPL